MLRPLLLTGGPAAGKSTSGRLLAAGRDASAFIDVDDIRQLIVAGAATLWSGPEGERQAALAAKNSSGVARNLRAAGFDVVIADLVTPATLATYRAELPECLVVHLRITLHEARRRASTRKVYLTDAEFELLHAMVTPPPTADVVLEVDGMTTDEQVARLFDIWSRTS